MPPFLLSYFDRFGRGLKAGESITFERGNGTAKLTSDIRQRLVRYSEVSERTDEVLIYAHVYEADKRNGTFQVEMLNGQRLGGPLREPYESAIMDALKTYGKRDMQLVSVQGVAKFDIGGKPVCLGEYRTHYHHGCFGHRPPRCGAIFTERRLA